MQGAYPSACWRISRILDFATGSEVAASVLPRHLGARAAAMTERHSVADGDPPELKRRDWAAGRARFRAWLETC